LRVIDEIGQITLPLSGGTYMLPEIVRRLDASHIAISDLSVRQPTLDDVFLALTGRSTEEYTDVTHEINVT
jgi:ABC-2 type transport system ATP-binding protein